MIAKIFHQIKENAFVRNSAVLFIGTMAGNALNYVFHLVIGRMVSVPVYGEIESIIALTSIVSIPAMTLTMIATKYSAAAKAEASYQGGREIFWYLHKKILQFGVPLFFVALLLSPLVRNFLRLDETTPVILLWFTMFLSFLGAVTTGILSGWQKFRKIGVLSVWGAVAKVFFGVGLVWLGYGTNGAVGSFVLATVVAYGISLFMLRFMLLEKKDNSQVVAHEGKKNIYLKNLKTFILPALLGNLAINILGNVDVVFAKHHLSDFSAGEYGALSVIARIVFFGTSILATVLFSMTAEREHKKENTYHVFLLSLGLTALGGIVATAVYFLFPEFVIGLLFGGKYAAVAGYLGWFGIWASLYALVNLILQYLLSLGKTRAAAWILGVSFIEILTLFLAGESISSILGIASLAQLAALATGFVFVWRYFFVIKRESHTVTT